MFTGYVIQDNLNVNKFLCAIQATVDKHKNLRTIFQFKDGETYQEHPKLKLNKNDIYVEMKYEDINKNINNLTIFTLNETHLISNSTEIAPHLATFTPKTRAIKPTSTEYKANSRINLHQL